MSIPPQVERAFAQRTALHSSCNWIFEVDYSIKSSSPRFFVYGLKEKRLYSYKCAHGSGGKNRTPHNGFCREVSNIEGSLCSSLGVIRTGEPYLSDLVGRALRLDGLSPTNSAIRQRGVVLHGGTYVSDNAAGTDKSICGMSWGCIVVADRYINFQDGGELIQWLRNGSIGVTHYGGKFKI